MVEQPYKVGESLGLSVWTQDEAGPFQTVPYEGYAWQPEREPKCQPHEYVRNGTAKLLTLFHPSDGEVRVKGATSCPNTVLHPWLQLELRAILTDLPRKPEDLNPETNRALWEYWCAGLDNPPSFRARSRQRRHALGGSGACTRRPIRRPRRAIIEEWRSAC